MRELTSKNKEQKTVKKVNDKKRKNESSDEKHPLKKRKVNVEIQSVIHTTSATSSKTGKMIFL